MNEWITFLKPEYYAWNNFLGFQNEYSDQQKGRMDDHEKNVSTPRLQLRQSLPAPIGLRRESLSS